MHAQCISQSHKRSDQQKGIRGCD